MITHLEAAIGAAKSAGELLRDRFQTQFSTSEKAPANFVTEIDLQAEQMIVARLRQSFPEIPVLAEEQHNHPNHESFSRWIIDPLDGTTNYIHGYPMFCVSIALEEENEIKLGVVYAPVLNQLFTALHGQGAFLNGDPIKVSKTSHLKEALLGSGFPYDAWENDDNNSRQWSALIKKVVSLRCDGVAAYDMCMVASGILDGYWELDLEPWDMAAGALILREAGGKVTLLDGKDFSPFKRSVVASNSILHQELLEALR